MDLDNDELESTRKMPCNQIKYNLGNKKEENKKDETKEE